MRRPPRGLCVEVRYRYCRDGDTVVVSLRNSEREWAIRLINCWCPELNTAEGRAAKAYASSVLDDTDPLDLWIPAPEHVVNLLRNLTFDRIPGHLFISSSQTLSEQMVAAGHATKAKGA